MKSRIAAAALFAMVVTVGGLSPTNARAAGKPWFGLNAGIGLPSGSFADVATSGWNAGVTGDYHVSDNVAVGGEVSWHTYGGSDDFEKGEGARLTLAAGRPITVNAKNTLVPVLLHAKLLTPWGKEMHPYGIFGLGIYHLGSKVEYSGGSATNSDTKFGFNLGAGASRKTSGNVELGVEARYHWITGSPNSINLLTVRGQMLFAFGG
jgi:opacity protein-like surface antigen